MKKQLFTWHWVTTAGISVSNSPDGLWSLFAYESGAWSAGLVLPDNSRQVFARGQAENTCQAMEAAQQAQYAFFCRLAKPVFNMACEDMAAISASIDRMLAAVRSAKSPEKAVKNS